MDLAIDKFDQRRFGLVTGSACHVLFPKKDAKKGIDTYARKLAREMFFEFYDEVSTWQTEHGNFSEHEAFEYYQANHSKTIEKGHFIMKGECGGTSDALDIDCGIDFKCPTSLEKFTDYIFDGLEPQQEYQGKMYCYLFDKPVWNFCIYLTETMRMNDYGLTYPVKHDKRMIIINVYRDIHFEQKLQEILPNFIEKRNRYLEVFKKLYSTTDKV